MCVLPEDDGTAPEGTSGLGLVARGTGGTGAAAVIGADTGAASGSPRVTSPAAGDCVFETGRASWPTATPAPKTRSADNARIVAAPTVSRHSTRAEVV